MRFLCLCLGLAVLVAGLCRPVLAETRALLVGVSRYDESIGLASLRGPANDVALLRQVFSARGVGTITLLADGIEGAGVPTRLAILSAMADLARVSVAGDLAIIHLSGHGTRQADQNGDETDGLDEVFLPGDVGRAEPGARIIPNALTDDEIGAAVLAIRTTGADVWLVMDSCNSGSGLRAGAQDVAARWVDPATLGVGGLIDSAAASSPMDQPEGEPPGQVLAFYAARSSEVAREVNLTPGASGDAGWYGLFTSRLAARLQSGGALSYRQLFQAVLSDMNQDLVPGGARMQTPGWEGGLIDAAVLGGQGTTGLRQFAVSGDEVAAGLVHGMGNGTLLALVADAAAPADAALGFAQIEDAAATLAYLSPVAADCAPRSQALCPTSGALPAAARFARLVARPLDLGLRLSPLRDLVTGQPLPGDSPEAAALQAALAAVAAAGQVQVITDPTGYEIEVAAADGVLWFGRRVQIGQTPVGLSWSPGQAEPLARLLTRIAEAEQLAVMLGSVAGAGSMLNPSPVSIDASVLASRIADLDPPGPGGSGGANPGANPARECRRALGAAQARPPEPLADASDLKQCDRLRFSAQGAVRGARDVNRVHIDSRFCIHTAYARIEDEAAAAALGPPMDMCSDCPDGYSAGDERLFVIVTESRDNADALNLEGLLENCTNAGDATRGAEDRRAVDFLTALGQRPDMRPGTRGSFGGLDIANVWVTEFRWQVLPKDVVFARVQQGDASDPQPQVQARPNP